jgi:hypothetical protein
VRPPRRCGQGWSTLLCTHTTDLWAAEFLPVTDLRFQLLDAVVLVGLATRLVGPAGVTRPHRSLGRLGCSAGT